MTKEETSEKTDLEQEIDSEKLEEIAKSIQEEDPNEQIEDNQFQSFMQSSAPPTEISIKTSAPVLDKVADAPGPVNLEQDIIQPSVAPDNQETNETEQTNYIINEPTYSAVEQGTRARSDETNYERPIEVPVLKPRESSDELPRSQLLDPTAGMGIITQNTMEQRLIEPEIVKDETRLPFEQNRDDKKYKEFRP